MTQRAKEQWYDECIQLKNNGELDKAVEELTQLTKTYPNYALAHLALSVLYHKLGNDDKSLAAVARACELETDNPFYYTAFSAMAIKSGDRAKAEEALMKAQEARLAAYLKSVQDEQKS
ncbi:MAG: hypothetical protein Q4G68_06085 [Planctomycetia bacterium]|nr:hypothetical protein [Planctomycetia bacterium]